MSDYQGFEADVADNAASERLLSFTFEGALVQMFRTLDLPKKIQQAYVVQPHRDMDGEVLEAVWKQWIKVETWRRYALA